MIGGRCDDKKPRKDRNGRLTSADAFDTNPGTWHLVMIHQIGLARRSFVMDSTYDYEVWNQPIVGYECSYFNPATMKVADSLDAATIRRDGFKKDRFARYRSKEAVFLVGVNMRTTYVHATEPEQKTKDGPKRDVHRTVDHSYDLELDEHGRILGGEWYNNRHPDFLWTPPPGATSETSAESIATGTWRRGATLPRKWRTAARKVAPHSSPLGRIVRRLITLSGG